MGLTLPEDWGGHALPNVLGGFTGEMLTCANQSISMFAALTQSASKHYWRSPVKNSRPAIFLSWSLVDGSAPCASRKHRPALILAWIRTRATPKDCRAELPAYTLQGTKIFISAGEHTLPTTFCIWYLLASKAPRGSQKVYPFPGAQKLPSQ